MRKKITAMIVAAAMAPTLVACGAEPEKKTHYDIQAALSADKTLTATVKCDYVNSADVPLSELWFNMYPNAYREGAAVSPVPASSDAYPNGASYASLTLGSVSVNGEKVAAAFDGEDENVIKLTLPSALEPTDSASVVIEYTVTLPNVRHRFGYVGESVNLGNFYPIACVYRDGAFIADPYYPTGDPFVSDVADYTVRFAAPKNYAGAFTGTVDSTATEGDMTVYNVSATNVRDFAAAFGEFKKATGSCGSVLVNYLYTADPEPEKSLETAIAAIERFSELFGDYAYAEYTVAQVPFLHGGMEYPQLSFISDAYSGDAYRDVIVHETAHQWWYAAVGNDEVRDPWLDEALAEYSTMMFYEGGEGAYTFDGKRADALTAYMLYCENYKNNGRGDTSMNRPINEYANDTEYTYMTYVKGALMLDDVRNTVGDAAFKSALKSYYKDNMFKIVKPADLVGAVERSAKRRVSELFDAWLEGSVKLYANK